MGGKPKRPDTSYQRRQIETENKRLEQEKLELKKQKEQVATKNTETFKRKRRRKPNELINTSSTGLKGNKLGK